MIYNRKTHVKNNPINFIDTLGLCSESTDTEGINWGVVANGTGSLIVDGIADAGLSYSTIVEGFLGIDNTDKPTDLLNSSVDAITGNYEAGDVVEAVGDYFLGELSAP